MGKIGISVCRNADKQFFFEYPETPDYFSDSLYEALDLVAERRYIEAEPILRHLVETCPNHIDAITHLAVVMRHTGREIEALALAEFAVNTGNRYIQGDFVLGTDRLPWHILYNRPYLRACFELGREYMGRKMYVDALSLFNEMLALNPEDNQGARELAVNCLFQLNMPSEVLAVCGDYPNDILPGITWGRVLALFQTENLDAARLALAQARETTPKVAVELLRKQHRKPEGFNSHHVEQGGDDQAYRYWKQFGAYWDDTEGAKAFLE